MPNWSSLTSFLGSVPDSVTLTLPELAAIVGGLPKSAAKHRAWWSGDRTHVGAWKSAGFDVTNLQMGSQVTFVRRGSKLAAAPKSTREPAPPRPFRIMASKQNGSNEVENRVASLIGDFVTCLKSYDEQVPFKKTGQYSLHRETIDRRRSFSTVHDALNDEAFLDCFRRTLFAWGIGKRGSRLVPLGQFGERLRESSDAITSFEHLRLDDPALDITSVAKGLWQLIEELGVVENKSLIVPGSKTLHHLLPDLVPPMDRAWTGAFFLWSMGSTKYEQRTFVQTFTSFANIAQASNPSLYVGDNWRTSLTKILDNSIIGYCKLNGIEARGS